MTTDRILKLGKRLIVASFFVLALTGCWDRLEIEERAVVLGVSIDTASPEAEAQEDEVSHLQGSQPVPSKDMIRVAVQIALPGRIPLGPGESGGGGKGGAEKTVWVVDVVGHSLDDAIMNLQQQISSRLFFGHLRVIVVSEKLAEKGLENVNDYFRRNSEVRRMAWMMVSRGNAKELMVAAPKLERVPTLYLMSTLDEGIRMGKFPKDYIGIFWSNSSKKGQEGFLPYVELKKEQNVQVRGLAFFRDSKMVGKSSPLQIAGYLGIKGINPAGYRVFVKLDGAPSTVMTAAAHRSSKIGLRIRNGKPVFSVHIAIDVNLEEKMGDKIHINDPKTLRRIELVQQEGSDKSYKEFLEMTQKLGSDICGFGEIVRSKQPAFWNRHVKTKERWQKMYKEVEFEVTTSIKIRRIGMKAK